MSQIKHIFPDGLLDARRELLVARSIAMLDVIMLAIGLGFFALSIGYTIACDRL